LKSRKKIIYLILIFSLIFVLLNSLLPMPTNAATESLYTTRVVEYTPADSELKRDYQSVFYKKKTIQTKPIIVDAGAGKFITKIVLKKDGVTLRTINVNAQTYNQSLTLNGESIPVKSVENNANGSWIAWQRSIAGTEWQPGTSENDWSIIGNSSTGSETFGGVTKDKWPGKVVRMTVGYARNQVFRSIGSVDYDAVATTFIDDSVATLLSANPYQPGVNVKIDSTKTITSSDGPSSTTDPSTVLNGITIPNLNKGSITFTQNYDHEGFRVELGGNGSAAMMYYFATYTFDIKSFTYRYPDTYEVYTKDDDGTTLPPVDPTNPGGGTGECTFSIGSPSQVSAPQTVVMDPASTGVILADDGNNAPYRFDVGKGIPTSENLYANTLGYNYLFQHTFGQMTGKVTYICNVDIDYVLKWKEKVLPLKDKDGKDIPQPDIDHSENESKTYSFTYTKDYSYWEINNLELYGIEKSAMSNYALPGGEVTLTPSGYVPPTLASSHSDTVENHVKPREAGSISYSPPDVTGGYTKPSPPNDTSLLKSMAEGQTQNPLVKNDKVDFNGQQIMNDTEVTRTGPTPTKIPNPTMISSSVLYQGNLLISSSLLNKLNTPSTGTIYYSLLPQNINGGSDKQFSVNSINTVTVHTPAVIYGNAADDAAHNQKTIPNYNRRAFILDRNIKIYMPTSGQHRDISGYGDRNYAKYIKTKQVRFDFDVYSNNKSEFYPTGTWINIPVSELESTFFLPVWVDEGDYTVYFRTFAENSPSSGFTTESEANLNLSNYIATDTVPVEVIGRLYDFRITDIADPNWETVFRTAIGSNTSNGTSFTVGTKGIDGDPNGTIAPYVLPIIRGSHPLSSFKSISVKTGYHFKFDLKSKGNMFGDMDAIRVTPTFFFQDNNAATPAIRVEVDLYYHSDTKKFVKVGSASDNERRNITLNTRMQHVPVTDIVNTAGSLYDMNTGWSITKAQYISAFQKRSTAPTYVGGYYVQLLPSTLRTFINTFNRPANASASAVRTNASIQQWYGEYSLPSAVYAVKKGTDLAAYGKRYKLDEKSPVFLKNGFIAVNFNIESIKNSNLNNPHLQYINGPLDNQWWDMEEFDGTDGARNRMITDPYGVQYILKDGDVVFYDASKSSYDDFGTNGTH
jgi:hypothetical protein